MRFRAPKKRAAGFVLAALLCSSILPVNPAAAEPNPPNRQFSTQSGEIVLRAQENMAANQYDMALNDLANALSRDDLSPYEKSVIYQMQGSCFYELDQYADAIRSFKAAIEAGGLSDKEASALRMNIAQLLIASDRFTEGAELLEQWERDGGTLNAKHIEMLWQAWSQAGDYARGLPWAEKWFTAANPKQRKHFDTMNFFYNRLEQSDKQAGVVIQMINRWPDDKELWDALASLHAHNGREQEAFEVRLRQYDAGLLTDEAELQQLIQYHSFYGIPYWGAKLMAVEMEKGAIGTTAENYTKLADLWRQAREYRRAIPVLKKAVSVSKDPANSAKLAEALYHQGRCGEAEAEIVNLSQQGGKNLSSLYTQLGVCYYEKSQEIPRSACGEEQGEVGLKRHALQMQALDGFKSAADVSGPGSSVSDTARSWTSFIKAEQGARVEMCAAKEVNEKLRCFEHIELAYENIVFSGSLEIEDECKRFVPEYITKFRSWEIEQTKQVADIEE